MTVTDGIENDRIKSPAVIGGYRGVGGPVVGHCLPKASTAVPFLSLRKHHCCMAITGVPVCQRHSPYKQSCITIRGGFQ